MDTYARSVEDESQVRVGDAERDECMAALTEHHVRGPLSVEELDHRHKAALVAVTKADLRLLLADLPSVGSRPRRVAGSHGLQRALSALGTNRFAVRAAAATLLVTGAHVQYTWGDWQNATSSFEAGLVMGAFGYGVHWATAKWHARNDR